jgi:hypothetical protein
VFPAYADTTVALRCIDDVRQRIELRTDEEPAEVRDDTPVVEEAEIEIGSPDEPAVEETAVREDTPSDDPVIDQSSQDIERRKEWWKRRSASFDKSVTHLL